MEDAMLKKIFILMILIPCCVSLSGCLNQSGSTDTGNAPEKILGLWNRLNYDINQTWRFKSDNTLTISGVNLTIHYLFANSSLFVYYSPINYKDEYTYRFNGNDELILTLVPTNGEIVNRTTGKPVDQPPILFQRVKD